MIGIWDFGRLKKRMPNFLVYYKGIVGFLDILSTMVFVWWKCIISVKLNEHFKNGAKKKKLKKKKSNDVMNWHRPNIFDLINVIQSIFVILKTSKYWMNLSIRLMDNDWLQCNFMLFCRLINVNFGYFFFCTEIKCFKKSGYYLRIIPNGCSIFIHSKFIHNVIILSVQHIHSNTRKHLFMLNCVTLLSLHLSNVIGQMIGKWLFIVVAKTGNEKTREKYYICFTIIWLNCFVVILFCESYICQFLLVEHRSQRLQWMTDSGDDDSYQTDVNCSISCGI